VKLAAVYLVICQACSYVCTNRFWFSLDLDKWMLLVPVFQECMGYCESVGNIQISYGIHQLGE